MKFNLLKENITIGLLRLRGLEDIVGNISGVA